MGRLLSLLAIAALCCGVSLAVPAKRGTYTHTQRDGSTVTVRMVGDAFHHQWVSTTDGRVMDRDANGDFYYLDESEIAARKARAKMRRGAPRRVGTHEMPVSGTPRIPVLLVQYKDIKFKSNHGKSAFTNGYVTGDKSVQQYFSDQSNTQYVPQFEVFGPYTLSKNRSEYGGNSGGGDKGVGAMVAEAVKMATDVNFANYDNDGNGNCDVVIVLYAGVGEAQAYGIVPNAVWPCQWDLNSAHYYGDGPGSFTQNGKTINRFAVFNELNGSSDNTTKLDGIGTFCHEFSHCLGLPDFYETNTYEQGYYGMGSWSLMDYGCYNDDGYTPIGYSAYEKEFMGWLSYTTPVANTKYTLPKLNSGNDMAVKVTSPLNSNEYYILENRSQQGWDEFIPDEGMMVTHVTYMASRWQDNSVNNQKIQLCTIIPADNSLSRASETNDLWPYGSHTELTNTSTPAAELYMTASGSLSEDAGMMDQPLTEITRNNDGTVSFWYMRGEVSALSAPTLGEATNVKGSEFTANWSDANTISHTYTLQVTKHQDAVSLVSEDFSSMDFAESTSTDIGTELDKYTATAGWTGSKVFPYEGYVQLGSSNAVGYITTPPLDLSDSGGKVTVKFRAGYYDSNSTLKVSLGSTDVTQPLTDTATDYTLVLDCTAATGQTISLSTTGNRKRVRLCNVEILAGDASSQAPRRAVAETGDADSRTITGITTKSYTVTGLTPGATYDYKVKAVPVSDEEALESDWSATKQVALGDPDPVIITDLSEDALDFGTITLGSGAVSQTLGVLASDLKADVTLALADESNSFAIDVTTIAQADAEEGSEVVVTYDPQTYGSHTATLTISSTDAEPVVVTLTGVAELEKEVPVLDELDELGVNASAFRASWGTVANVSSYTLQVDVKQDTPEPVVELLLDEDFSVPANTTWARSATGTYNETSEGYLRLGTTSLVGSITSPAVNLTASNGLATVIVTAKSYGSDANVEMKVSIIDDDEIVIDSETVTLTSSDADYEIVLTGNASNNNYVRIESLAARKRVMLKEAKVYSGDATSAGAPRRATETGDETTRTITGITDTYYEVNDLASETTYTYKVKAVYIDGTESEWSAANEVTTKAVVTGVSDVAIAADVTEVRYYNVHGQQIARPQQGVNIVVTRYADGSQKALKVVY